MSIEQIARRLRALELSTRGSDYVLAQDAQDARESDEKPAEKEQNEESAS